MSSNWDALQKRLDGLKKPTTTFTICDDDAARQRLHEAKATLRAAEEHLAHAKRGESEADQAAARVRVAAAETELQDAQAVFEQASVTLTFQALDRKVYADLQKAHPATEEEEAEGDDFHMETFGPALIAAASVEGMPEEYARHLLDTWTASDAQDLLSAAFAAQHQQRTDLGKG